jgi:hypothetical protein
MPTTNQELVLACDRALQGINEVKQNAVRLAQLEQQIKQAEGTLAGLNGKIEQAKKLGVGAMPCPCPIPQA